VRYEKGHALRFISHLDVVRAILRALAVSGLPVVYTQGFNPHPKLSFGPPLPVGSTGEAEFLDLELTRTLPEGELVSRLEAALPDGLVVLEVTPLSSGRSVSALAEAAEYVISDIEALSGLTPEEVEGRIADVRRLREAEVRKGSTMKTVRPSEQIIELELLCAPSGGPGVETPHPGSGDTGTGHVLRAVLALGQGGAVRPADVVRFLGREDIDMAGSARIHRVSLLRRSPGGRAGLEPVR